jgi:hypothetical protein
LRACVISVAVAVALATVLAVATPAAAGEAGPAPEMYFVDSGGGETVEVEAEEELLLSYGAPDGGACKRVRIERRYRSPVGLVMLRYWQTVRFCYNGSRVTSIWRNRFASTELIPWEFEGHISNSCNSEHCEEMAGRYSAYIMTQGQFRGCWLWSWYCDTKTPGVGVEVRGNGTWPWHTFA